MFNDKTTCSEFNSYTKELKESFENSWRNWKINKDLIDINLQSEPLYSTTVEELEHFTQTLEKNLGKTREQIFQEIKETIKNIG